jgi:hypothetical protein
MTSEEHKPDEIAAAALELTPEQLVMTLRAVWRTFARCRPDLAPRAWPLMAMWVGDERPISEDNQRHALAVAQAAIRQDLFGLTATDRRLDTDLLGAVLTLMRSKSSLQARGQFYTPGPVAETIGEMITADSVAELLPGGLKPEGMRILEPASGTGGMMRAMAEAMRARGVDPARHHWSAVDIDYLAIACLAVNVQLWGLGYDVLLGVGDALLNDWQAEAEGQRREMLELAKSARMLGLIARVEGLVRGVAAEPGEPEAPEPQDVDEVEPVGVEDADAEAAAVWFAPQPLTR